MSGLRDLAVAFPRPDHCSAQVKHKYLFKALFSNKGDHCFAAIQLEKEMIKVSTSCGIQNDYVTEPNFDFQSYPLFSLALLWRTKDWLQWIMLKAIL